MPVRTKRLAVGSSGAAAALSVIYTCPAGETAIVKDVRLYSGAATQQLARILLRSGPTDVFVVFVTLNTASTFALATWIVMQAGDQLLSLSDLSPGFRFVISGTELEGVAD